MSSCVSADRHQRMTRQLLKLIFVERLAVYQRPAINPALRNRFAQMRQKTKVLVNEAFEPLKREFFAGEIGTFNAQVRCQRHAVMRLDQGGQPEPPTVDLTRDHASGDVDGKRRAEPFHDRESMAQVIGVTVVKCEAGKWAGASATQPPNGFVQIDKIDFLST